MSALFHASGKGLRINVNNQVRQFGLRPNALKRTKGSKLLTRKSWCMPRNFRGWYMRRRKKLQFKRYTRQKEVVLGEWDMFNEPLAVSTASDARTPSLVKIFPNLGIYNQKAEHHLWNGRLDGWIPNDTAKKPEEFRLNPKIHHILNWIHLDRIEEQLRNVPKEIDWHFKPGDVVELEMYTSLKKGTTHKISGLCMERRQNGADTEIVIRNTEKDGLVIIRAFPIYTPWMKGLKIMKRYNNFKLEHLYLLRKNFPDIWNPEDVPERLEVIKQDIIDKRSHAILVLQLKKTAERKAREYTSTEHQEV